MWATGKKLQKTDVNFSDSLVVLESQKFKPAKQAESKTSFSHFMFSYVAVSRSSFGMNVAIVTVIHSSQHVLSHIFPPLKHKFYLL